jgi:hypothetical protein
VSCGSEWIQDLLGISSSSSLFASCEMQMLSKTSVERLCFTRSSSTTTCNYRVFKGTRQLQLDGESGAQRPWMPASAILKCVLCCCEMDCLKNSGLAPSVPANALPGCATNARWTIQTACRGRLRSAARGATRRAKDEEATNGLCLRNIDSCKGLLCRMRRDAQ